MPARLYARACGYYESAKKLGKTQSMNSAVKSLSESNRQIAAKFLPSMMPPFVGSRPEAANGAAPTGPRANDADTIEILRVLYGARDIETIMKAPAKRPPKPPK